MVARDHADLVVTDVVMPTGNGVEAADANAPHDASRPHRLMPNERFPTLIEDIGGRPLGHPVYVARDQPYAIVAVDSCDAFSGTPSTGAADITAVGERPAWEPIVKEPSVGAAKRAVELLAELEPAEEEGRPA
jgi:hypothetical protein